MPARPSTFRKKKTVFHRLVEIPFLALSIAVVLNVSVGPESVSLNSLIASRVANFVFKPSSLQRIQAEALAAAILSDIILALGVVCGVAALFGITRYGRKGILVPVILGVVPCGLGMMMTIPAFARHSAVLTPPVHTANASRVIAAEFGFSFDLPEGYEPFDSPTMPQGVRFAYMIPSEEAAKRVILVKPLGGTIPNTPLSPSELPADKGITTFPILWRGLSVAGYRVPESVAGIPYVSLNVQVPLRAQAVQFNFGGPADDEADIRAIAGAVLSSLEGETNW
ncbi:MAG TPA: hypothetical protein VGH90_11840 [Chthoniobacteraceae bacterium]|jgi:hypothetical protein